MALGSLGLLSRSFCLRLSGFCLPFGALGIAPSDYSEDNHRNSINPGRDRGIEGEQRHHRHDISCAVAETWATRPRRKISRKTICRKMTQGKTMTIPNPQPAKKASTFKP